MIQQYNILVVVDIAINILMAVDIAMQYIAHHRYCKNILYEVKTTNYRNIKRDGKEWNYTKNLLFQWGDVAVIFDGHLLGPTCIIVRSPDPAYR
jgi:hypothetical protein